MILKRKSYREASLSQRRRGLFMRRYQRNVSTQLLLFLILVTLFKNSGDQCMSHYDGQMGCCSSIFVSAGAAEAARVEPEEKKREKITVHAATDGSRTTTKPRFGKFADAESTILRRQESKHQQQQQQTFSEILKRAGKSGIGGGVPGAVAGVTQVLTLMWLRTVMNYQCRYGASFPQALNILYSEGGIPRFYRGLSFALIQAPLARFVSTAANDGVETLLANLDYTREWGPGRSTVIASIIVGMWRMALMPIDTCKTVLQVDSVEGFRNLMRKVKAGQIHVLYQGALANAFSAIAAHYPWFYTYRVLSKNRLLHKMIKINLLRNAITGFVSSVVSDTFANAIRVVKTTKQAIASKHTVSYGEVVAMILAADGWKGLFGRGLRTRILGNAVQSVLFTVIWRGLADRWSDGKRNEGRKLSLSEESGDTSPSSAPSSPVEGGEEDDAPIEEERI